MSILLGDMLVRYKADITDLTAKSALAKGEMESSGLAGNKIGSLVSTGLLLATGAAVAFGAASVKMAGDFQSSMTSLVTGAGESKSNLQMVGDGILAMAGPVGTTTDQLASGMYLIESAGQHGAQALTTLQDAAEGARVGSASLADVANGVTTEMTDYASSGLTAAQATNTLIAAVSEGKTHMGDLSQAMSTILPTSAALHVSLTDTAGAMATMTGEGTPAAAAATYLRQMLMALESPAKKGADALKTIGLTSSQVSTEMQKSLPGALQMITDALGKKFPVGSQAYMDALKNISGGSKQMQGMLELTGQHLKDFQTNVDGITASVKKGGNSITGWADVQGDFNFKMDAAKASVQSLMISVGTQLLPVLGNLLDKITPAITGFTKWLTEGDRLKNIMTGVANALTGFVNTVSNIVTFFQNNQLAFVLMTAGVILLAGAIGGILVSSLVAAAIAAWAAMVPLLPFILIGAAVAAVIALIVLAVMHWGEIAHWLQGVWGGIAGFFVGLWNGIKSVWGGIGQWFQDLFAGAWNGITSTLGTIGGWFVGLWNGIKSGTKAAWDWIVNALKVAGKALLNAILAPFIAIGALFQWLYNHNYYFKDLVDSIVSTFKAGIKWIQDAWTNTVNWLVGMWATIQKDAVIAWHNISSFFSGIWQNYIAGPIGSLLNQFIGWFNNLARQTWTLTKAVWQKVSDVFSGIWQNYIAGPLGALWNAITGWLGGVMQGTLHGWEILWQRVSSIFSGIWNNYIAGPLRSLWTQFSNFFGNLAGQAIQWGQNLIKGFIDGINNMAGAAGQAAQNVAGQVGGFLGFHSPSKEGPGKDADKWMPNLIKMLVGGLNTGAPQVKAASQHVAAQIIPYPIKPSAVAVAAASQASQSSSNQQQTFILEVDGHKLAEITNKHTDRTVRLKLGDRGRAA